MVDATSFAAALQEYYTPTAIRDIAYKNHPTWALVTKKTDNSGKYYVQAVQYGRNAGGRSRDFAKSATNRATNLYTDFQVPYKADYNSVEISHIVMRQSEGNAAFFDARTREIDGMIGELTSNAAKSLFNNGGGARGRIATATGSLGATTITLTNIEDVVNFEIGMVVRLSADDGTTGSLKANSVTLTGVNRDTGVLTAGANWSTITSAAQNDYIFVDGDFGAAPPGFDGWIPRTSPSGTFLSSSVNRNVDPTRLGGCRVGGLGLPVSEAVRKLDARMGREGFTATHVVMSPNRYLDLELEQENKVQYVVQKPQDATIGFTGMQFTGQRGTKTVLADPDCPDDLIYALTLDTWKVVSLGPVPDVFDMDGKLLRVASSDSYEVRAGYFCGFTCEEPAANGVCDMAA